MTAEETTARRTPSPYPSARHTAEPKVLRIGVLHGGRILEERLIPTGQSVSVGEDERCTIVLPPGAKLQRFELMRRHGGRMHLQFRDGMQGRVAFGQDVESPGALATSSRAEAVAAGLFRLPLDEQSRGKVTLGEFTLLFQFVAGTPRPRGRGRRDLRAWRREDADWMFHAFLLGSALLHTAFIIWTESQPPPKRITLEEFPDRVVDILIPLRRPEPPPPAEPEPTIPLDRVPEPAPVAETTPAPPPPERDVAEPDVAEPDVAAPPETEAERLARKAELASQSGLVTIVGTRREGDGPSIIDLLNDLGRMSAEAARSLQNAANVGVSSAGTDSLAPRVGGVGDEAASIGQVHGVEVGRSGDVADAKVEQQFVRVTSEPLPKSTPGAVLIQATVRRAMGRVKSCYERELKTSPDLAGKLTVSWVISATGQPSQLNVVEDTLGSQDLAACVMKTIAHLRFPPEPDGAEVDVPSYPFLFAPQ